MTKDEIHPRTTERILLPKNSSHSIAMMVRRRDSCETNYILILRFCSNLIGNLLHASHRYLLLNVMLNPCTHSVTVKISSLAFTPSSFSSGKVPRRNNWDGIREVANLCENQICFALISD